MKVSYPFNSLEDFLISTVLTVDGQLDDGWGASFPVKGREIEATILFADISGFTKRTHSLSPTETLIFVNNFFAWVTAEALQSRKGVVDKYIGDEMMIVFSKEFGSEDPFVDAMQVARWMSEHDALSFCPHIGIASGIVIVGYVGTPVKYNCSVFGLPVAIAARCAGIRPEISEKLMFSSSITFPAAEWGARDFSQVFPPERIKYPDGEIVDLPLKWEMHRPRMVKPKNLPDLEVREIINKILFHPSQDAEERAKESLEALLKAGRYWPRN